MALLCQEQGEVLSCCAGQSISSQNKTPRPPATSCTRGQQHLAPETDNSPTLGGISSSVVLQVGSGSYASLFSCSTGRNRGKTRSKQELSLSMRLGNEFTSLLRLPRRTGRICAAPPAGQHQKGNVPILMMDLGKSAQPVLNRPEECFTNFHIPNGKLVQALPGRRQAVKEQGNLDLSPPFTSPWPLHGQQHHECFLPDIFTFLVSVTKL